MTNAEARFNKSLRPRKPEGSLGRTAQDVQLDSHTAPELCLTLESSIYIIYKVKVYRGDVMVSYIVRGARSGEVQVALVPAIPGYNKGRKLSQRVSRRLWITEWLSQGFGTSFHSF